jgi:hypothetical protein
MRQVFAAIAATGEVRRRDPKQPTPSSPGARRAIRRSDRADKRQR